MNFILRYFCLAAAVLLVYSTDSACQVTAQWASIYNGVSSDTDEVSAITVDNSGNVYVTGFSKSPVSSKDIVTLKYNPQGQQIWSATYNNPAVNGNDLPTSIAFDNSGNILVAGRSDGNGTFSDMITIKYSPEGSELWNARYDGAGSDEDCVMAIVTDSEGNIVVTGYSVGATSSEDFTTIMYSATGIRKWISSYNNPAKSDIDIANSIAQDAEGNFIVAGYSNGSGSAEDVALLKYDPLGNQIWVKRYNGAGNSYDITTGIDIDNNSNIFISGYSYNSLTQEDFLTLKYNSDGILLWERSYDGTSDSYDISYGIKTDPAGNCIVCGFSYREGNSEDFLTVKYDNDGNLLWDRYFNGPDNSFDIATDLETDASGNVYVTGYSFGNNSLEDYTTLKYNSEGNLEWYQLYDGISGESDIANSLVVDAENNVYVSGFSYTGAGGFDYVTVKYSQTVGIYESSVQQLTGYSLFQNYPNPFNGQTVIEFELSSPGFAELKVFDLSGKECGKIAGGQFTAGKHRINFDSSVLPGGVYLYELIGNGGKQTRKMVLVK